jgi:multidrug efflux pump subunit AcrA (membrane-fusion protein)
VSKKTKTGICIVVALALVAALAGYFVLSKKGTPIEAATVSKQPLSVTVLASGRVTAGTSIDIYPEVQGLISRLRVEDGERVQAGDVLADLDASAQVVSLSQAQAGLAQAQSSLSQARAAGTSAASGINAAKSSLSAAKAGLKSAQAAYTGAKKLRRVG